MNTGSKRDWIDEPDDVIDRLTKALAGAGAQGKARSVGHDIMWLLKEYSACNLLYRDLQGYADELDKRWSKKDK